MTGLSSVEVAKRLRKAAGVRARYLPGVMAVDDAKSVGFGVIAAMGCRDKTVAEVLNGLADLVDRPECCMELTVATDSDWGEMRCWRCSHCGNECVEVDGCYERCPRCGAVVREERR